MPSSHKQTSWIVQTNVERESASPALLRAACNALGLRFHGISVVRGSSSLPDFPSVDGPVVFHGRETLIRCALGNPHWASGVFFSDAHFTHSAYVDAYGDDMLNAEARVVSFGDLLSWDAPRDTKIFVRPDDDSKRFPGQVTTLEELAGSDLDKATRLVVGDPKEVDAEWRLFFVEDKVVSGSMYRPSADRAIPTEVIQFAEAAARRWTPAAVFVMDVARVNRTWKIIECNCFNGSRFYEANVEAIVEAVSRFQAHSLARQNHR